MLIISMIHYLPMECGSTYLPMDMCGFPTICLTDGILIPMAVGSGQIMVGPGYLILTGVGLPFIMAAGDMIIILDGIGFPVMFGGRHGFHGVGAIYIWVGPHFLLMFVFTQEEEFTISPLIILNITGFLSKVDIFIIQISTGTLFQERGISLS